MRFLILLSPGVNWREGVILHNQPFMPEHAVYVQQKYNEGKIIFAGPFGDLSGGAILIDVVDEEEVKDIIENDPSVKNGVFCYELKRWGELMSKFENINPNFGEDYIKHKHETQKNLNII